MANLNPNSPSQEILREVFGANVATGRQFNGWKLVSQANTPRSLRLASGQQIGRVSSRIFQLSVSGTLPDYIHPIMDSNGFLNGLQLDAVIVYLTKIWTTGNENAPRPINLGISLQGYNTQQELIRNPVNQATFEAIAIPTTNHLHQSLLEARLLN